MMELNRDIEDLIIRFFEGKTSPEENIWLEDWKNVDEKNEIHFNEIRNSWYAALPFLTHQQDEKLETRQEYKKLSNRIWPHSFISKLRPIAIAASIIVAIFIGAGLNHFLSKKDSLTAQSSRVNFESVKGSVSITTLPDGTKIWMNGATEIAYNTDYNREKRIVELNGEAYFDVVTNPDKPFIVKTKGIEVVATGTSFNIKSYASDPDVTTTLIEGILHIEGKDKNNQPFNMEVKPLQTVTYFADLEIENDDLDVLPSANSSLKIDEFKNLDVPAVKTENINPQAYTSWKDDRWIIENDKLSILKDKLERRFNVKIIFNDKEIANYRFSGSFETETIEEIMEILKYTIPVDYKVERGIITMKTDSKAKTIFDKAKKSS